MMSGNVEVLPKLLQWIDDQRENIVRDIIDLLAIKSVAVPQEGEYPFGEGCAKALNDMLDYAKRLGFQTENHENYCGTCTLPGTEGKKSIGVFCHLDVVPEGDGWSSDPYKAFVNEDDYIVARGSSDNKGPAIAALYALRFLKEHGIRLKNDIRLVYGCAEEIGMYDMDYYVSHVTPPDFSLVPDCPFPVCYAEKGNVKFVISAPAESGNLVEFHAGDSPGSIAGTAKAVLADVDLETVREALAGKDRITVSGEGKLVQVSAEGISKHSAAPEGSVDAIHLLADALSAAGLLNGEAAGAVQALADFTRDYYGESFGIQAEDEVTGRLTHACCTAELEEGRLKIAGGIRYPICVEWDEAFPKFKKALEAAGYRLDELTHNAANKRDPSNPLYHRLTALVNEQLGVDFKLFGMGGGTYARKLPNAVGFGPGRPDIKKPFPEGRGWGHQPDEGVRIQSMLDMVRVYVLALMEIDRSL